MYNQSLPYTTQNYSLMAPAPYATPSYLSTYDGGGSRYPSSTRISANLYRPGSPIGGPMVNNIGQQQQMADAGMSTRNNGYFPAAGSPLRYAMNGSYPQQTSNVNLSMYPQQQGIYNNMMIPYPPPMMQAPSYEQILFAQSDQEGGDGMPPAFFGSDSDDDDQGPGAFMLHVVSGTDDHLWWRVRAKLSDKVEKTRQRLVKGSGVFASNLFHNGETLDNNLTLELSGITKHSILSTGRGNSVVYGKKASKLQESREAAMVNAKEEEVAKEKAWKNSMRVQRNLKGERVVVYDNEEAELDERGRPIHRTGTRPSSSSRRVMHRGDDGGSYPYTSDSTASSAPAWGRSRFTDRQKLSDSVAVEDNSHARKKYSTQQQESVQNNYYGKNNGKYQQQHEGASINEKRLAQTLKDEFEKEKKKLEQKIKDAKKGKSDRGKYHAMLDELLWRECEHVKTETNLESTMKSFEDTVVNFPTSSSFSPSRSKKTQRSKFGDSHISRLSTISQRTRPASSHSTIAHQLPFESPFKKYYDGTEEKKQKEKEAAKRKLEERQNKIHGSSSTYNRFLGGGSQKTGKDSWSSSTTPRSLKDTAPKTLDQIRSLPLRNQVHELHRLIGMMQNKTTDMEKQLGIEEAEEARDRAVQRIELLKTPQIPLDPELYEAPSALAQKNI